MKSIKVVLVSLSKRDRQISQREIGLKFAERVSSLSKICQKWSPTKLTDINLIALQRQMTPAVLITRRFGWVNYHSKRMRWNKQ